MIRVSPFRGASSTGEQTRRLVDLVNQRVTQGRNVTLQTEWQLNLRCTTKRSGCSR